MERSLRRRRRQPTVPEPARAGHGATIARLDGRLSGPVHRHRVPVPARRPRPRARQAAGSFSCSRSRFAAARDAAAMRDAVLSDGAITGMWTCDELVFDASVRVRAARARARRVAAGLRGPLVVIEASTRRRRAVDVGDAAHVEPASGAPPTPRRRSTLAGNERLGQIATATAGFRDQFYGLSDHVVDRETADERCVSSPRHVWRDRPGSCAWGDRPLRYAGARWQHPRVDVAA